MAPVPGHAVKHGRVGSGAVGVAILAVVERCMMHAGGGRRKDDTSLCYGA